MHEWPLLIFTLLLQGAVGLTLFLTVKLCATSGRSGKELIIRDYLPALWVICLLAGGGLLASVFHLGYPLNAFNALRHFSSSWLSREIIFASLFLSFAGLSLLLGLFNIALSRILVLLALLVGFIDVFYMSSIYTHTSVVTWMHENTPVMFYGSVAIVGAVAAMCVLPAKERTALYRWAAILVIAAVLVRLLIQPSFMTWLNLVEQSDVVTFPHHPLDAFNALSGLRLTGWLVSIAGALVFATGCLKARRGWLVAGGVLLLIAEVILRFIFFSIR